MAEHVELPGSRHVGGESTSDQPVAESRKSGPSASADDVAAKQDDGVIWPPTAEPKFRRTKRMFSLRLDHDVLEWFKGQGPGYQTRMNDVLRAYAERAQTDAGKSNPSVKEH